MINATVRRQASRYRNEFVNAYPFPHIVIDYFFEAGHAERLLAEFPPFDPANALNEFGEVGRKATVTDIGKISPFYAQVYRFIASQNYLDFISQVTGIPDLLFDESLFGGGTHENLEGQDLDPHVDFNYLEDRMLHRRLNVLLYLNKEWEKSWGGCIELHSNPRRPMENQIKVVTPLFNRCVIFETSERSWHGFERIRLPENKKQHSRKMLSVYLYTRDRPAEQIAPPHSTFYVQRAKPARLVPGHTLTEEDVRQIEQDYYRRDNWIEHYQKMELENSRKLQALTGYTNEQHPAKKARRWVRSFLPKRGGRYHARYLKAVQHARRWARLLLPGKENESPSSPMESAQDAPLVPLTGYAHQEGPALGFWPDGGWIGSPFEVAIRLQKPLDSLIIQGYLPEQFQQEIELCISVNGVMASRHRVQPGLFSLQVSSPASKGETMKLRITSDKSYCPARAGTGADIRDLVFSLREIHMLPAAQMEASAK